MTSSTQRGGGDLPNSINLFSRMGDKGEGGVKNLKKWVTSFMDNRRRHTATLVCGKCSTGH